MWIKHFPVLFNVSSATDMWPFLLLQEEASVPQYIELWGNHRNTNKHFGMKMETHTVYDYAVPFRNQTPGSISTDYSWRIWQVKKSWIIKTHASVVYICHCVDWCLIFYLCFFSLQQGKGWQG